MSLLMNVPRRNMHIHHHRLAVPVDVVELEDSFIVQANLPGFELNELSVELDFETLKISAKKEQTEEEKETKYLHRERYTTQMARTLRFHKPVDANRTSSSFKNGVLSITIPFAEIAKTVTLVPETN